MGLNGWVRNERDGSVAALIAGPQTVVSAMLDRFRRGPAGASVSGVETQPAEADEVPDGFRIEG